MLFYLANKKNELKDVKRIDVRCNVNILKQVIDLSRSSTAIAVLLVNNLM